MNLSSQRLIYSLSTGTCKWWTSRGVCKDDCGRSLQGRRVREVPKLVRRVSPLQSLHAECAEMDIQAAAL